MPHSSGCEGDTRDRRAAAAKKRETKCNNVRKFRRCRQLSKALIHTHTSSTRQHDSDGDAKKNCRRKSSVATSTHTRVRIRRTQQRAKRMKRNGGRGQMKEISADEREGIVCVAPSLGNDNKIAANVSEQWSFCSSKN